MKFVKLSSFLKVKFRCENDEFLYNLYNLGCCVSELWLNLSVIGLILGCI